MIRNKIKHVIGGRTRADWLIFFYSFMNQSFLYYNINPPPLGAGMEAIEKWRIQMCVEYPPSVKLSGFNL